LSIVLVNAFYNKHDYLIELQDIASRQT